MLKRANLQRDRVVIFYRFPYANKEDRTINSNGEESSNATVLSVNDFPNLLYTDIDLTDINSIGIKYPEVQLNKIKDDTFFTIEMCSTVHGLLVSQVEVGTEQGSSQFAYRFELKPIFDNLDLPSAMTNVPPMVDAFLSGTFLIPGAEGLSNVSSNIGEAIQGLSNGLANKLLTMSGNDTDKFTPEALANTDASYTWNVPKNKYFQSVLNLRTMYSALMVTGYSDGNVFPKVNITITKYAYYDAIKEIYPMYSWFRSRFAPLFPGTAVPQFLFYSKDVNNKLLELNLISRPHKNYKGDDDILFHVGLPVSLTMQLEDYDYTAKIDFKNNVYDPGKRAFYKKLTIKLTLTLFFPYLVRSDDVLSNIFKAIKAPFTKENNGMGISAAENAIIQRRKPITDIMTKQTTYD